MGINSNFSIAVTAIIMASGVHLASSQLDGEDVDPCKNNPCLNAAVCLSNG